MSLGFLFRHFRRKPESNEAAARPLTVDERLWRKAAFTVSSDEDECSVQPSDPAAPPLTFPQPVVDWLLGCTTWAPIQTHLKKFNKSWGPIDSTVSELMEAGLLVAMADVLEICRAQPTAPNRPPPITALGFPTGGLNGLKLLPRAIRSFAENFREHQRQAEIVVCDSSADPSLGPRYRELLQELAKELGQEIRYIGDQEKRQTVNRLVELGACDLPTAEFALLDPLGTGFAAGANRNAMLLDQTGKLFCSVDHDVLAQVTGAPESGQTALRLFSECDPFERWLSANRAEADTLNHWQNPDYLALHESMLGRDFPSFLAGEADQRSIQFEKVGDALLRRLKDGPSRVRATFCGHAGDPGIPSALYYMGATGANRARLTKSEKHYQAALRSGCQLALTPVPAIGDASLSPGMAFALDHRELLPPFFPVLHAEDYTWSGVAWECCPGMLLGLLPWAIAHEPFPGNQLFQIENLAQTPRFVIWEWAHLLRFWAMTRNLPPTGDAAHRTRALGHRLKEIAFLRPPDFADELQRVASLFANNQIAFYETQLATRDTPRFLKKDLATHQAYLRQALKLEGFELPWDLQKRGQSIPETRKFIQNLLLRYAKLLEAWPDMVAGRKGRVRAPAAGIF